MEFYDFVLGYDKKISFIKELFSKEELVVLVDRLKNKKQVESELIYFKDKNEEHKGCFIFGFDFFQVDLSEQEFKKVIGFNSLNLKILNAYKKLKEKQNKVKITDILNEIQDKKKDSPHMHAILRRILTLSYYLNWRLEKDLNDLEGDSFIDIPDKFIIRLKQRYNFDIVAGVYEDENLFLFLNAKGRLNCVFKTKDKFTQMDIEKFLFPVIRKVFKIKKIVFEN